MTHSDSSDAWLSNLSEDDTSFASIADFFSLLSISFIYFAILFGASPQNVSSIVKLERAEAAGLGAAVPLDPRVANVSLLISPIDGPIIRIISPAGDETTNLLVRAMAEPLRDGPNAVIHALTAYPQVNVVVLYMSGDSKLVSTYELRDRIGAALVERYEIRLVLE